MFPRNVWFSPCPSSPSAYSYPAETRARLSLPECVRLIKAKGTVPPLPALVLLDTPGRKHGKRYPEPNFSFPPLFRFVLFLE